MNHSVKEDQSGLRFKDVHGPKNVVLNSSILWSPCDITPQYGGKLINVNAQLGKEKVDRILKKKVMQYKFSNLYTLINSPKNGQLAMGTVREPSINGIRNPTGRLVSYVPVGFEEYKS